MGEVDSPGEGVGYARSDERGAARNRNANLAEGDHPMAKSEVGFFDTRPNGPTGPGFYGVAGASPTSGRRVAGFTWVSGGAGAMSTANCPCTGAPDVSAAFAFPASPATTV